MPTTRRKLLNKVTVDIGCSNCRKPKLFHIFHPKPKPTTTQKQKYHHHNNFSSSSSSCNKVYKANNNATTFSPNTDYAPFLDTEVKPKSARAVQGFGRIGNESVAVEKDSGDPYLDFRHSMLQMILENEIYAKDDLRELLNCFLQLNAPCNHGIIIRVFTEIWNAVFTVRSSGSTMLHFPRKSRDY
ncbi:unnamed protein product [Prunus armeniaca]|uniref:Transcription repressor n=2 Tax=Prunus TaxID=3754 RepID=A0A6J5XYX2_PRUAR|nr:PREDICTED: transcription repressor OFP6 [Prunus mume]KAH0971733.1 hypothetical protein GBA52_023889 [Prunus armeniaca]CAB4287079.1 unnamed protein product [Prunus armeniaca]CAB4317452.1 unnamed protein product [Prunus armeniaca]